MNRIFFIILLLNLYLTKLIAGDYKYKSIGIGDWELGEISGEYLIYYKDEVYRTHIPVIEIYWKYYVVSIIILLVIFILANKWRKDKRV